MIKIQTIARLLIIVSITLSTFLACTVSAMQLKADEWQLISFPKLPANATVASIFNEAASNGKLTSVWTFNNNSKQWQSWPAQTGLASSDLSELTLGQGYWVKTTADITLDLSDATEAVGEMVLYPGWNLIGLSVDQTMGHEQAMAGVPFLELWKYDADQNKFLAVQKSRGSQIILKEEFSAIEPGTGLWVYMAEQSSLLPSMGTLLPPDIDIEPLLNLTQYGVESPWGQVTPGDVDWDNDGYFDFPNTQHVVSFGDFLNRQRISITNEGNGVLSWQATIEPAVDWLLFEAFNEDDQPVLTNFAVGNVSNTQGELILVANRTGMAPSDNYKTQIVLRANGSNQEKRIDVSLAVADVVGDYEMTVRLDDVNGKAADLHNPKYFLSFARDGQGVKAFLDEERSLLIPQITYLSGDYVADPESHFQILGQLYLPAGHEHNPYTNDIRREFTVIGQRSDGKDGLSPLDLKGTYAENVYGIFDDPIQLKGEFVARRLSPNPKKKDQLVTDAVVGDILAGSAEHPETSMFNFNVTDRLSITDVKTALRIEHPEPEALTLKLTGPQWINDKNKTIRTTVVLHENQTRSLKDVRFDDYDPAIGSLDDFDGQLSYGQWSLEVKNASTSVGKLASWVMDISGAKVYQLTGTLPDAGVKIQISGCGVVQSAVTDSNGHFVFDGLIPCDYELKVLQLGYEITTTNVRIIGCMQGEACDTPALFSQALSAEQLAELQPKLVASSGAMKVLVSPTVGQLPITLQAVDVTDYDQLDKTLQSRTWQLFKRINNTTAISDDGYLIDVQPKAGEVEYGKNYFSYSEDFTQWKPNHRVSLTRSDLVDPRGGFSAVQATVVEQGYPSIGASHSWGEGGFPVSAGDKVTLSVFLKELSSKELRFRFASEKGFFADEIMDFTTGLRTGGQDQVSKITPMANGWYRAEVSVQVIEDHDNFYVELLLAKSGNVMDVPVGSSIAIFGPQVEVNNASGRVGYASNMNSNIHPDPFNIKGWGWSGSENGTVTKIVSPNPSGENYVNSCEQTGSSFFTPIQHYAVRASVETGEKTYLSAIVRFPSDSKNFGLQFVMGANTDLEYIKIDSRDGSLISRSLGITDYKVESLENGFYLVQVERIYNQNISDAWSRITFLENNTGSQAPIGSKAEIQGYYFGRTPLSNPYNLHSDFTNDTELNYWSPVRYTKKINNGNLNIVSNAIDPQLYKTPVNFETRFDGNRFSKLVVKYRNNIGLNHNVLFFGNETSDKYVGGTGVFWGVNNSPEVNIIGPDAEGFYISELDLKNNSRWTENGLITRLRFDFASDSIGTDTDIDFIKIYDPEFIDKYVSSWPATYIPPKPLSEVTASAYIPTQATHAERSINGQQDVLIAEQTTGLSGSFSHKFTNLRSNAGVYYVKLNSDVKNVSNINETISYSTQDILAQRNPEEIHVGTFSVYGAAGSSSLKAMDSATYDLDRFPLISETGSQGIEDSDGFKADDLQGDAYETNAPNDVNQSSPGVYNMIPTGIDATAGNQNQHYKMYISAGQLYQGGSMYSGNVRLDVGIQSQEESK